MKGLTKRSFTHLDRNMFLKLYKSIIRPHLEYANVIWSPLYKGQIDEIEKVQRRATKIVPSLKNKSYLQRLTVLGLPSIRYRQIRSDLIQAYKIINKIDNLNCENFFKFTSHEKTRNNTLKIYKPYARTNIRKKIFSYRVVDFWNKLSPSTKTSPDLTKFKINIDKDLVDLKYNFN